MSTTGTVLLVGGVGVAIFLLMRSQQQQQAAVMAATSPLAAVGGGGGGGLGGLAGRVFAQWKQDPLGVQNTKAAASTIYGVGKSAVSTVAHLPTDIIGGIKSIF